LNVGIGRGDVNLQTTSTIFKMMPDAAMAIASTQLGGIQFARFDLPLHATGGTELDEWLGSIN
jgi:hypothetical protein